MWRCPPQKYSWFRFARATTANQIDGKIVRETNEKKARLIANVPLRRHGCALVDKQFLKQIAGIGFISSEIEKKGKQRLDVILIKALKLRICRVCILCMTPAASEFV